MELLGQDLVCVESSCQMVGYSISGMPRTPAMWSRSSKNSCKCLVAKSFQPILNHRFPKKAPFPYKTFLLGAGARVEALLQNVPFPFESRVLPPRANQVLQLSLTTLAAFLSSLLPGNSVVGNYFLCSGFLQTGTHELVVTKWKLLSKFKMFFIKHVLYINMNMSHLLLYVQSILSLSLSLYILFTWLYMYICCDIHVRVHAL